MNGATEGSIIAAIIRPHMTVNDARFIPIVPGIAPISSKRIHAIVAAQASTAVTASTIDVVEMRRGSSAAMTLMTVGQAAQANPFENPDRPSPDHEIPNTSIATESACATSSVAFAGCTTMLVSCTWSPSGVSCLVSW